MLRLGKHSEYMSQAKICPCCKRPMPDEMDDTRDLMQAAAEALLQDDPRRAHPRNKKVISITLRAGGLTLEAVTMDISDGGARVFYLNGLLPVNAELVIEGGDHSLDSRKATTVWSHKQEKTYSISGIKFC